MHGGYNWHKPLSENSAGDIMWDRHIVEIAQYWTSYDKVHGNQKEHKFKEFDKIFVGHTTTQHSFDWRYKSSLSPAFLKNLVNLDTGAGWNGKLTIMDVDTNEYWQSDLVIDLYPAEFNARQ